MWIKVTLEQEIRGMEGTSSITDNSSPILTTALRDTRADKEQEMDEQALMALEKISGKDSMMTCLVLVFQLAVEWTTMHTITHTIMHTKKHG